MVSKEVDPCVLSNSESESEGGGPTLGSERSRHAVHKRNKALQVLFKDICEAQNEAARLAQGARVHSVSCKVVHKTYMTMPARRSIPNVTKSTAVQTSPELKKRYQTFPFERKKGNTIKHIALVENYEKHNNGFLNEVQATDDERPGGGKVQKTRVLLHSMPPNLCADMQELCPDSSLDSLGQGQEIDADLHQPDSKKEKCAQGSTSKHKGLTSQSDVGVEQKPNFAKSSSSSSSTQPLQERGAILKVTGPIAWTSLTQVECLESPSVQCKRKKEPVPLNGLQSKSLPCAASCPTQDSCKAHVHGSYGFGSMDTRGVTRSHVYALPIADGNVKARLQAMETLASSSQETIKVLLGVIQELEKGEAQREGRLSYRTGQDTTNCDMCRNSACIIYSVELDFKLQEDKFQALMKRLCPAVDQPFSSLPYTHEVYTSTPKRKSKAEAKKHARWRLWFL